MSVGTVAGELRRPGAGAAAPRARTLSGPTAATVAALTLLAAVLRFTRIGHQGFWFDEANTAQLVHFSPGKMLGLIPRSESTPPLYYSVAWIWARVFGYGEAGLRSLSAVLGVALVPVAFATGAKLSSRRAGLIAAALVACSPLLNWYSQEARSYEMLAFLASASLLAFAYARDDPTPRALAVWVITSALALATHYYAVLIVAPEALWLLAMHRRRREVQIAFGFVGLCGLGLLALALAQNANGRDRWIAGAPLGRRLGQVVPQFAVSFEGPGRGVLEPLAIAIIVLALVLLATCARAAERRGALVAGSLALAGLVISLVLIALGFDDLLTRNLLALWLPAALVVAGGLAAPRPRAVGLVAAAALCLIGVVTTIGVAVDRNYQRPDWRVVARVLGPAPTFGSPAGGGSPTGAGSLAGAGRPAGAGSPTRAILVQHYRDLLPLSLYTPGLKFMPRHGARVREFYVVSFTSPASAGFCWWGSACNLWPSVMQAAYPVPGFHEVSRRRALQFTVLKMVSSRPVQLTPAEVARVLRTTRFRNDELLIQR